MERSDSHGQLHTSLGEAALQHLRFRRVLRYIPQTIGTCLDVGCGFNGNALLYIQRNRKVQKLIGIDLSVCENPKPGLTLLKANLDEPLPIETDSVSVITSLAVLEHLHNPEGHIKEAYKVMKKGGILLLTTPTPMAKPVLEFLAYRLHILSATEIADHKHYFTPAEIEQLLEAAGFESKNISIKKFQLGFNTFVCARK